VPAAKKVDEWYSIYTRAEVSFDWQFHDTWITLPFESARYSQSEAQQNTDQWGDENVGVIDLFWSTALEAADPSVDFTGVEIVYFICRLTRMSLRSSTCGHRATEASKRTREPSIAVSPQARISFGKRMDCGISGFTRPCIT